MTGGGRAAKIDPKEKLADDHSSDARAIMDRVARLVGFARLRLRSACLQLFFLASNCETVCRMWPTQREKKPTTQPIRPKIEDEGVNNSSGNIWAKAASQGAFIAPCKCA